MVFTNLSYDIVLYLQNWRLRLKKANKAAKANRNRKRFRKNIILLSTTSSWFYLQHTPFKHKYKILIKNSFNILHILTRNILKT